LLSQEIAHIDRSAAFANRTSTTWRHDARGGVIEMGQPDRG
jgi:hypothetical protein